SSDLGRLSRMYEVNYGLEVGFGSVTGMFAYQYNAQVRGVKDHIVGLSTRAAAAGGDILFGVRGLIGKDDGAASNEPSDRRAWSVNAAYEYPLSKRTTLWAYGAFSDGSKQLSSKYSVGQVVNYNGAQAAAGMTHKF
ncbi:porin, partial [uncultured Parasutterella sp.]|uniref:porin n=1 Tax=uncultured Parasutterella sp. TaxID=1263098 RepID=UPI00351C1C3C